MYFLAVMIRTRTTGVSLARIQFRAILMHGFKDGGSNVGAYSKQGALAAAIQPAPQRAPVPLLAPKPGYAAPIAALSMPQPSRGFGAAPQPPPVARARPPPVAVPSAPHPLPPTMTPILPVFARPTEPAQNIEVKWGPEPILRGNTEEKLLPRGDDFWRRFSMVAREENKKRHSQKLRYVTLVPFP